MCSIHFVQQPQVALLYGDDRSGGHRRQRRSRDAGYGECHAPNDEHHNP
jgi:hypothetical protein